MAKKKKILEDKIIKIKKSIEENKAIFGTKEVIAALKVGGVVEVFLASNCQEETEADINIFADGVPVEKLEQANDDLGVVCKKPFSITVMGIKK